MTTDQFIDGAPYRLAAFLKPGDRIDLEGDLYADPDRSNPSFPYRFCVVEAVTLEPHDTDPCIRVDTEEDGSFGFPPDHLIAVDGEQERTS